MAEEQGGQRKETWHAAPWTKLFSAFRIAVLPSKLLLAAGGIVVMAVGWWVLAWLAFTLSGSTPPMPEDYLTGAETAEQRDKGWKRFKAARQSWNLMNEMAGDRLVAKDAGDLSGSLAEYNLQHTLRKYTVPVRIVSHDDKYYVQIGEGESPREYQITPSDRDAEKALLRIPRKKEITYEIQSQERSELIINEEIKVKLVSSKELDELVEHRQGIREAEQIIADAKTDPAKKLAVEVVKAMALQPVYKPYGRLRILPWDEYRGPNPYLVVTEREYRDRYVSGFFKTQVPVLLEPLVKFFLPVVYFLDAHATFGIRLYLLFVILWTLGTWALFGGAITRIAVVQAARPTERIGMFEALRFARSRLQSFFSAPLIPLVFLAVLTLFMIFFGALEGFTVFIGDLFLAVLFWPLIFIMGLVMALVLVGLIGWPLMYATISAEGSDSFDALSRSYSYVFQAIWRYLWYCVVALIYGAILIFFVGFMGSLMVYMGKWGVSQTPFLYSESPANDRDPTYYFVHAPKSFGWRDLLLRGHPHAEPRVTTRPNGEVGIDIRMSQTYRNSLQWYNHVGAFFVAVWLYLLFLLVLGFGYSYFWTAASIIYLLMRWKVDDTEIDEIHLEEDEEPLPEMPVPMTPGAAPTATPAGTPGFTMVEPPGLRTPPAATPAPPHNPPPAAPPSGEPAPPPPEPPPSAP
jgi:hypothetical protein